MKKKISVLIENMGWSEARFKNAQDVLIPLFKNAAKFLELKNSIIIHLYPNKNEDDLARAQYDEGIIIIYENCPDIRGDAIHEFAHQLLRPETMSITLKSKLNNLKKKLDANKGDGRIFFQKHTHSDIHELFATLFKWYMLGKLYNDAYLDVLNNFQPEAEGIVEKALKNEKLIKSKEEKQAEVMNHFLKAVTDQKEDQKVIEEAKKVVKEKIGKYKLEKAQEDLYIDLVIQEMQNRKVQGRYSDLRQIINKSVPGETIDEIGLTNPVGIFDDNVFSKLVRKNFNHLNGNTFAFHVGIESKIKNKLKEKIK